MAWDAGRAEDQTDPFAGAAESEWTEEPTEDAGAAAAADAGSVEDAGDAG